MLYEPSKFIGKYELYSLAVFFIFIKKRKRKKKAYPEMRIRTRNRHCSSKTKWMRGKKTKAPASSKLQALGKIYKIRISLIQERQRLEQIDQVQLPAALFTILELLPRLGICKAMHGCIWSLVFSSFYFKRDSAGVFHDVRWLTLSSYSYFEILQLLFCAWGSGQLYLVHLF